MVDNESATKYRKRGHFPDKQQCSNEIPNEGSEMESDGNEEEWTEYQIKNLEVEERRKILCAMNDVVRCD